jgi:RNA polymerase sigma factor (sigma-70 family)
MPSASRSPQSLPPGSAPRADVALPPSPTPEADDQELIRRLATRDPHAFEQLYQRYARRLQGYLRRLLPPQVLPEDVLHEVMLLVWQQAERFDPGKPLLPWLFGIARRKALEAQRAARPRPTLPPDTTSESAVEALELGVARQELTCAVMQALRDLPPAERQVVELTYYHGLSYPEIAGLAACPVNTLKARMARGRRRLASHLAAWGLTPAPAAHHTG